MKARDAETAPQDSASRVSRLRHLLSRITEPLILFPGLAVLALGTLMVATIGLARVEYTNAHAAATVSTRELTDTYEAQVVRAMREIDRTLKLVAYAHRPGEAESVLSGLSAENLLLPAFLFTVHIADADGRIEASTAAAPPDRIPDGAALDLLRTQDILVISPPASGAGDDESILTFARRLSGPDNRFEGIVTISVAASYFVSGYDPAKFGQAGFIGLLGTDGIFRAARSGETITTGATADYRPLIGNDEFELTPVSSMNNPWDGVKRFTAARKLYEFPLVVVVGLSEAEQLSPAAVRTKTYVIRSTIASITLIALLTLLGYLSWQLQQSRQRVAREQVAHAKRIEYLAQHDILTGLPNRAFFGHMLTKLLALAKRYQRPLAVLFLDLDHFKLINDTLGHDTGDALLKEVARRLQESVRESDIVARLAGDEFVVLLPEQCDEGDLTIMANRILTVVGKPYDLLGQEFRVTVSVGISRYPKNAEDEESLLKAADVAMYHAKEKGRNKFHFYQNTDRQLSLERMSLEVALRQALERQEFSLHYQEQRDLATGDITGMEALLRWTHPQLGEILPRRFLPIAEESGLIIPIGKWVIETACRESMAMQQAMGKPLTMCVNLSPRQFTDPNLAHDLGRIVRITGIDPGLLELGVAESALLANVGEAIKILGEIRMLGVRIAIDNFGASYSSLSTLNRFRFDTVNIDGSVIRNAEHSPEDQKLMEATIAMGKNLAFTVVAEGVETEAQARFLRDRNCDKVQGFYFGRPAPLHTPVEPA